MTGASTPTTLKMTPPARARRTTRSLSRPKTAAESFMNAAVTTARTSPTSASGTMMTASQMS